MIDSVTLVCKNSVIFNAVKSNSRNLAICGDRYSCYYIPNGYNENNFHSLILEFKRGRFSDERIEISGSIRKWYLGSMSDRDLQPDEFRSALLHLSYRLGIDENELYGFEVSNIEVGVNISSKIGIETLKNMVVGYRNDSYERCEFLNSCNYSLCKNKSSVIIYDKFREISRKFRGIKSVAQVEFINRYKDSNLLRIEAKEREAKNIKERLNIGCIGDVARDYKVLLRFFFHCLNELSMRDIQTIEFNPEKKRLSEVSSYFYAKEILSLSSFEIDNIAQKLKPDSAKSMRRKNKKVYEQTGITNVSAKQIINLARRVCVNVYCPNARI